MAATQELRLIITAKNDTNHVIKKINGNLGKMRARFNENREAMRQVGIAGSLAFVALGAGIKSAISTFADFEKTMSGVQAVLQPTQEEMAKLTKLSKELGKTTQFSASQSAKAIEVLAKNGLSATQILNGAAEASLTLASATGGDLANAADIATDAMANFGIKAEDMEDAINGITAVTVASKFDIDDYRLALGQAGGVAGTVGVNFKDFNTTIAAIAPLFASGSDAGTSFKTFLQRLVPATKPAFVAMSELGIITEESGNRFFDAEGNMQSMAVISGILNEALGGLSDSQKSSTLSTLFGTDAMRAAAGLAKLTQTEFETLAAEMDKVSASAQALERLDNLAG